MDLILKIEGGVQESNFNEFKDLTYGNIPQGFQLPPMMSADDVDIQALMAYDSFLNFTDELIFFEPAITEKDYSMLATDIAENTYIDGVTPELDLVFDMNGGEIGVLGLQSHPSFGNLTGRRCVDLRSAGSKGMEFRYLCRRG